MAHDRDTNINDAVGGASDCPRHYTDYERKQGAGQRGEDFLEIERLRAALHDLIRAYVNLLEVGRDRITMLGGDCDSVEKMETGDPALIAAKAALQSQT